MQTKQPYDKIQQLIHHVEPKNSRKNKDTNEITTWNRELNYKRWKDGKEGGGSLSSRSFRVIQTGCRKKGGGEYVRILYLSFDVFKIARRTHTKNNRGQRPLYIESSQDFHHFLKDFLNQSRKRSLKPNYEVFFFRQMLTFV